MEVTLLYGGGAKIHLGCLKFALPVALSVPEHSELVGEELLCAAELLRMGAELSRQNASEST